MTATLADIQERMQDSILSGDDTALDLLARPPHNSASDRLNTYLAAYQLRLMGILEEDYDCLHEYLGDEQFSRLGHAFIQANPSHVANARYFSKGLASFAASQAPWSNMPAISDVAALQWALGLAFDARDSDMISMDDLAQIPVENIPDTRFGFHPSMTLLDHHSNAIDIFTALRAGETPPGQDILAEPSTVLIWRHDHQARYRVLEAEEAMLLREAQKGQPFALLCEMAAMMGDPDNAAARIAGYLRNWIDSQLVTWIRFEPQA